MSTTTDLSTLKINYLTQAQYDDALENGDINPNELYFTPDTGGSSVDTDTTYSLANALSSHKFTSTLTAGGSGSGTSTATIELAAGNNVTLTDDTTNKKITIAATDTNTTYTFSGGTNKFTVTPSGGSAQDVTVTPSITDNITGTATTVEITVANWNSGTSCSKTVSGVTASNKIVVAPIPADMSKWSSAGVYCSAQASGSLTFTCTTTPTATITVNILILN